MNCLMELEENETGLSNLEYQSVVYVVDDVNRKVGEQAITAASSLNILR